MPVISAIVAMLGYARPSVSAWAAIAINTRRSPPLRSRRPAARPGMRANRSCMSTAHQMQRRRSKPVGTRDSDRHRVELGEPGEAPVDIVRDVRVMTDKLV